MAVDHVIGRDCLKNLEQWQKWDQNGESKAEIEKLTSDENELHHRLCRRLEFGTAGLRGEMKAGFGFMNDLVIIQTTQGLITHVLKSVPDAAKRGVVVGFDGRHNSSKWSKIVANIITRQGLPVYLFSRINPTPFVPYVLMKNNCACGIMITASHNPRRDNGYKVYWANGAQIKSPTDRGIAKAIEENLEPWTGSWDYSQVEASPLLVDPLADAMKEYYEDMQVLNGSILLGDAPNYPKFVYTPVHGVGLVYVEAAFKAFSIPQLIPVKEQATADPEFSTVKYPNPEEGPDTLELAFKTAEKHGTNVVIANDPDADRFACAEKFNGKWKILTGNQLGSLLGYWCWKVFKAKNPNVDPKNVYMLHSTVSSKMLESVGRKEGFNVEQTLTGFKWMGNRADEIMKSDSKNLVIFAFEEAIGFMCGTRVLDKDGVSAAAVGAQMITYAYDKFGSISGFMDSLYAEYGYHHSINSYFLCYEAEIINEIFDRLRYFKEEGKSDGARPNYASKCGSFDISAIRDLTAGYDSTTADNKPLLPVSSSSQMITFTFANGTSATLRTSGTEPKIKYYTELPGKPGQSAAEVEKTLKQLVDSLIEEFLQPERFGLKH